LKPPFKPKHKGHGPGGGGFGGGGKSRAPESTAEEVRYLKRLIEKQVPVAVKLRNNEMVKGVIEYYDTHFIRITRAAAPNLFIFKHEIKYIFEEPRA
jgi:sRNA-binding regulator protein Hfq